MASSGTLEALLYNTGPGCGQGHSSSRSLIPGFLWNEAVWDQDHGHWPLIPKQGRDTTARGTGSMLAIALLLLLPSFTVSLLLLLLSVIHTHTHTCMQIQLFSEPVLVAGLRVKYVLQEEVCD